MSHHIQELNNVNNNLTVPGPFEVMQPQIMIASPPCWTAGATQAGRNFSVLILSHFKSQKITSWFELSYFSENDPSLVMDFLLESELCLEWAELHAIPTRAQHLIDSRYFMLLLQRDEPDLSTATKSICDSLLVQLTSLPSLKFVISLLLNCYTISLGPDDLEHYKMVQRSLPVPPPPSCRARLAVHGPVVPGASGCMACPLTLISDSCPCASAVHEPLALGSGLVRSELGIASSEVLGDGSDDNDDIRRWVEYLLKGAKFLLALPEDNSVHFAEGLVEWSGCWTADE
uniref:(California timema) hypothetical protein n=1 Tax=Timema californicum TaxID=61474 RepID=A0A7R9J3G8_TIMCA|nr:unnamed protein product [Timema californicum]